MTTKGAARGIYGIKGHCCYYDNSYHSNNSRDGNSVIIKNIHYINVHKCLPENMLKKNCSSLTELSYSFLMCLADSFPDPCCARISLENKMSKI